MDTKAALSALGIQGGAILDQSGQPVLDRYGKPQSGLVNSSGQALDLASLRNIFTGGSVSTGIGGLDRTLNAGLFEGFGGQSVNVGNALAGAGYGLNAYAGFKRGGTGGTIQGIGSTIAAASLLTPAAPFAPLIAAGSTVLGGLFGGKKGVDSGTIQVEIQDGALVVAGSRLSKNADRDAAAQATTALTDTVKSLNAALTQRGVTLTGGGLATEQGVGVDKRAADFATILREAGTSASATISTILRNTTGATVEAILADLDFAPTYDALVKTGPQLSAFAQAMADSEKQYTALIDRSRELGLSIDAVAAASQTATEKLLAEREARIGSVQDTIAGRASAARGETLDLAGQIAAAAATAAREQTALFRDLTQNEGLSSDQAAPILAALVQAQEAERDVLRRNDGARIQAAAEANAQAIARRIASNDNLQDRFDAATGYADTLGGQQAGLERRLTAEWVEAVRDGGVDLTRLAATQIQERLKLERDYGAQSATIEADRITATLTAQRDGLATLRNQQAVLTGFLDAQAIGGPGVSPQNALLAAQQQLDAATSAARTAGPRDADLGAVTAAAQAVIQQGNSFFGGGAEGAGLTAMVNSTVRSLGASLDFPALGGDIDRGLTRVGNQITDSVELMRDTLRAEIAGLRDELAYSLRHALARAA